MTTFAEEKSKTFGYLTLGEVYLMKKMAITIPEDGVIVNVGAGAGTSGLAYRETCPKAKIYTVDFRDSHPEGGLQNERNAFEIAGLSHCLPTQILSDSKEAGKKWKNGIIDLLFIDAEHSYEGCKGDIMAWLPHVRSGGLLLIHDYHPLVWSDVIRAANEFFTRDQCIGYIDTLIAFTVT